MSYSKVNLTSSNLSEEKYAELRQILPEAFSENSIDWERLKAVLGDAVNEHTEKFSFSWAGKGSAVRSVLLPSKATLRPAQDESIQFDKGENLFIEGDNLEVLKLLQKAYFEKVKMIYIDPPYNTGGDFVYHDNFASPVKSYLQQTGQIDAEGNRLQTNKETNGRFHSDWLSMMYPRLKLAWNLLKDDGVIFVSIDDNEMHRLRMVMDEIFGEENFIAIFPRITKKSGKSTEVIAKNNDFVLCYQKTELLKLNASLHNDAGFKYKDEFTEERGLYKLNQTLDYGSIQYSPSLDYEINIKNIVLRPGNVSLKEMEERKKRNPRSDFCWRWSKDLYEFGLKNGFIVLKGNEEKGFRIYTKTYQKAYIEKENNVYVVKYGDRKRTATTLDFVENRFSNDSSRKDIAKLFEENVFDYTKPVQFIKELVFLGSEDNDIILDFFAGSGTTAHAVLKQNQEDGGNRKFILVQMPEITDEKSEAYKAGYKNIADISKERIRRVINGYGDNPEPIDAGFKVFKLGESNYPENNFEFDPEKSEEESKKAFGEYLSKAKQVSLFDSVNTMDIIYENSIKEGFSLNASILESKIADSAVWTVTDDEKSFLVCLERKISDALVNIFTNAEYKGKTLICFDSALDDTAKANLGLNLELKTI